MAVWKSEGPRTFAVHARYGVLAAGLIGMGLLLGYSYVRTRDPVSLTLALGCAAGALWHAQWIGTHVRCDDRTLTVHRIGRTDLQLSWSEVRRLAPAGPRTRCLLIEHGDPDDPQDLALPQLRRQEELLEGMAASDRNPLSP